MRPTAKALRLFEVRSGVSFIDCLQASANVDLVTEFDRLNGTKIINASPETPGAREEFAKFADFVYDHIFLALPETADQL